MAVGIGIALWVVAMAAWGWFAARARRRRALDPAARTPEQVWDETDPEHREHLGHPPGGPGFGS